MAEVNIATAGWLHRFAPDVAATVRRFPLAIAFAAVATVAMVLSLNINEWFNGETWFRLFIAPAVGAVCAVAGVLFVESRPTARIAGIVIAYMLPLTIAGICLIQDATWVASVPMSIAAASILWLSVSAFTVIGRGAVREEQQNRFWWLNHRAIATAGLAAVGFFVIFIGTLAIERSLGFLFKFEVGDVFYRGVIPVVGLFLTPVYWLSTLPRLDEYDARQMEQPDFTASAVGFLGQFVLAPFLAIYAAILLAYAGQMLFTQTLPAGTIGWMVLGFVVAGAGTWLVLHPPFMRTKPLVRLFRSWWFWLTIIPLGLFFFAVWVRLDAYGMTTERLILVSGGIWAAALTVLFLVRLGDIRLIPGLAGLVLMVFSLGPWNYFAAADYDQARRLSALLAIVKDPTATASGPDWTPFQAVDARSAIDYLTMTDHGRRVLQQTLLDHGHVIDTSSAYAEKVMAELGYPSVFVDTGVVNYAPRPQGVPIDVSATPYYIGHEDAYDIGIEHNILGFHLVVKEGELLAYRDGQLVLAQDLSGWAARQNADSLKEPWVDFAVDGVNYRLALTSASWERDINFPDGRITVTGLNGLLFTDDPASAIAKP